MYKIISVDLDGTLLSPQNKITKYTEKIIKSLLEKNFYFVFASGRHHLDIMQLQNILNIKTFIISSNGARVYDLNRQLIFSHYLTEEIARSLCKIKYFDSSITTQIYCDKNWYINNDQIDNQLCPSLSALQYKFFDLNSLNYKKINKIFFTSRNIKQLDILKKNIINIWHNDIHINYSMPGCLEVVSGKTSKGEGLKKICNFLKMSLKDCISFGDGMNDQDMLYMSGKGCIMDNADPNLKTALPYMEIIEKNKNDGVAKFLYNKFLNIL
ncbi:Cof-type HAD-IIB family hydrolase [Buchnera aphidicola]|uniref:Cof-type HAD-IIB family hydrolase n=1 Tax=Buchnera aphidicola TaxID=9 RepID=UPI003464B29B